MLIARRPSGAPHRSRRPGLHLKPSHRTRHRGRGIRAHAADIL